MPKAISEIAIGAGLVALDIFAPEIGIPATLATMAGGAGAGMLLGGLGSLLKKQQTGIASNTINPIAPWNVVYGRARVGGTTIWQQTGPTGESDKYWHRVIVLACHPCQSVDALLFDNKRVCLDGSGNSISFGDSTSVIASQQTQGIASISRTNDVVTVVMAGPMALPASTAVGPALQDGDTVLIENVAVDNTLNGLFQIQMINPTTFTYICGGAPFSGGGGTVKTQWPDYGDTVHLEVALGSQGSNPFPGLTASGDTGSQGQWTSNHVVQGMTAVYLRLKYGGNTYQAGIPTIGFLIHGKNDIFDPRSSSNVYTENSALCIADYMCDQNWGFKCQYGSDMPTDALAAAANVCDEAVPMANGNSEKRYTCNGSFQLSAKRGEILQNLLTSCAGRLTFSGGQYVINPAAWTGTNIQAGAGVTNAGGSAPVSATLYATTANLVDGGRAIAQVTNVNPLALLLPRQFLGYPTSQSNSWAPRTDSINISQAALGGLTVAFCFDDNSGAGSLTIYDCWVTVQYADGTGGTYRPTQAIADTSSPTNGPGSVSPGGSGGTVTTPGTGPLDFSPALLLTGFNFPSIQGSSTGYTWPDYMAGGVEWRKPSIRDIYNGCKGVYVSPLNNWQATDFPPYAQDADHGYSFDANLQEDGGDRRWLDIQLPFTISYATAQRIAKIELLRRRMQEGATFVFNLGMYQFTCLDILSMTVPFLPGWTNKLVEVQNARLTVNKVDEHAMTLATELDVQETDPSIYTWSTAEELGPAGFAQPQTAGTQTIAAPTTLTLGTSQLSGTNFSLGQIGVTWNVPTDGFIVNGGSVAVQYSFDQITWFALGTFAATANSVHIPAVSGGTQYYVRTAFINAAGVQSDWTVAGPITGTGGSLAFDYADDEVPTGAIDGANQTFTLLNAPIPPESLKLFYNEGRLVPGVDFTLTGNTITLTAYVPSGTDYLRADYRFTPGASPSGGSGTPATPLTITTTGLTAGVMGTPYSATLTATGGTAPYTWSAALTPIGLSLSPSGVVAGTPAAAGTFYLQASVSDSATPPSTAATTFGFVAS